MAVFIDQMGNQVHLISMPKRIVTLVPSQTELLYDLGLEDEVLGITKFCVHPQHWFKTKTRIGGTKQINIEKIISLKPDLIIANKEENVKEQVLIMQEQFPVWVSDVSDFSSALDMIDSIATITNRNLQGQKIIHSIKNKFSRLHTHNQKPTAVYLIWKDPIMTVGGDTFINSMLKLAGFSNFYSNEKRYLEISITDLQKISPEFLLLSSEPYPFQQKHIHEFETALPTTKIVLVNGEMFSWHGSRLLESADYFASLQKELF